MLDLSSPLSQLIPLADGVADTQRVGSAGIIDEAARADHIHPVARLAQLVLPDVTVGGQVFVAQAIWRQYTTEETQSFDIRVQVQPQAAGAWRTINFPLLPGYQSPQIALRGLYCPAIIGLNPWIGQHFIWGNTFYHVAIPTQVNADCYWNFALEYNLT
jgi:hypothetical protein